MKIAVLGAGHGGLAMSADLKLMGHDVKLAAVEGHDKNIKILRKKGFLDIEGVTSIGKVATKLKTDFVYDKVEDAIKGVDIIMVNVPAFAQDVYNNYISKFGETGQIVIFPCGGFSAINFYEYLSRISRQNMFLIGETSSFIYTTRIIRESKINIQKIKDNVYFSAYPKNNTKKILKVLKNIYPQYIMAENAWQTSFENPSSILHTITTLMSTSRIDTFGPYKTSYYDITPSVARLMEETDKERIAVARNFYSKPRSFKKIMCDLYNLDCSSLYETITGIEEYKNQNSPDNMKHRYIEEDIPYSLVPIAFLAKDLGIKTSNIDSIINLAGALNGENYWKEGRKIKVLNKSNSKILK